MQTTNSIAHELSKRLLQRSIEIDEDELCRLMLESIAFVLNEDLPQKINSNPKQVKSKTESKSELDCSDSDGEERSKFNKCQWSNGKACTITPKNKEKTTLDGKLYCSRHYTAMCKKQGVDTEKDKSKETKKSKKDGKETKKKEEETKLDRQKFSFIKSKPVPFDDEFWNDIKEYKTAMTKETLLLHNITHLLLTKQGKVYGLLVGSNIIESKDLDDTMKSWIGKCGLSLVATIKSASVSLDSEDEEMDSGDESDDNSGNNKHHKNNEEEDEDEDEEEYEL